MSFEAVTWVWDSVRGLKPQERLVMLVLANLADEEWVAYPSLAYLADRTELTRNAVRHIVRRLEDRALIERRPRKRDNGSTTSNQYRICPQLELELGSPPSLRKGGAPSLPEGGPYSKHDTKDDPKKKKRARKARSTRWWSIESYAVRDKLDGVDDEMLASIEDALQRWLDYRRASKRRPYANDAWIRRYYSQCSYDPETFLRGIDYSIDVGYQGVWPEPSGARRRSATIDRPVEDDQWTL